jgi:hypothetical protein
LGRAHLDFAALIQSAPRDPMFNLPGEINVGTNSTVELIVDEKPQPQH